jgi:predicted transcriptional regulator
MPTVTVKNIPTDLYDRLKQLAQANRRSINSEIIACIEQSVYIRKLDPDAFLANARALREKTSDYKISDEEFNQAKSAGRL